MASLQSVVKFVPGGEGASSLRRIISFGEQLQQVCRADPRAVYGWPPRTWNSLTFICARQQTIQVISRERGGDGENETMGTVPDFNVH